MKNFIVILIVFVLVMALSGCDTEEKPEDNTPDNNPEISEQIPQNGESEAPITAEFAETLDGEAKTLAVGDKIVGWTLTELNIDRFDDGDIRNITGYFFGEATLEGIIKPNGLMENTYDFSVSEEERAKLPYLVSPDGIRASTLFILDIPEGIENYPNLQSYQQMICKVTVSDFRFDFGYRTAANGLTVTKIEVIEADSADFTLGLEGERQTLYSGDKIGDWTVESVSIQGGEDRNNIGVTFVGEVTLTGYAVYNEFGMYYFYVDESDYGKMPFYISEDYREETMDFRMDFPEGEENPLNLKYGEKANCKITLSDYTFRYAPMMIVPRGTIIALEVIE